LHEEATPGPEPAAAAEPPPPALEARREGGLAVVSYRFGDCRNGRGEPARIVAAAFGADGAPSHSYPFPVEGSRGEFALQLPADREWSGVRAAATSQRGVSGETVAVAFARPE
jgi:hypothetical protein